ncbi:hypothetical protein BD310DRAFT_48926 [Dichomitus squalens]|uniref:Uncharacterized protein n=1 Tax=Dichomitus squalens TaxID=114155 RepID=A0A4Q9Q4Z0_9APHY|nr:hypothetical protein BD310DRAFT_48926 [Dichomitus squalens]
MRPCHLCSRLARRRTRWVLKMITNLCTWHALLHRTAPLPTYLHEQPPSLRQRSRGASYHVSRRRSHVGTTVQIDCLPRAPHVLPGQQKSPLI